MFEAQVDQFLFALCIELLNGKDHLSDGISLKQVIQLIRADNINPFKLFANFAGIIVKKSD